MGICERCASSLTEIDHYGERLTGCVECNFWQGSKRAFIVELSVEDFEALRGWETIGKRVQFNDETWEAVIALARRSVSSFTEEVFSE